MKLPKFVCALKVDSIGYQKQAVSTAGEGGAVVEGKIAAGGTTLDTSEL